MGITEQTLDIAKQEGLRLGAVRERKRVVETISKNLLKQGVDIHRVHEAKSMPIHKLENCRKSYVRLPAAGNVGVSLAFSS